MRASVECVNPVRECIEGAVLADPHLFIHMCMHLSMSSCLDVREAHVHAHVQRHAYMQLEHVYKHAQTGTRVGHVD